MCLILAIQAAGRNGDTPFSGLGPLPNPDSEFGARVAVTHSGGETRDMPLPFHAHPCDGRPGQRVEGVTFEPRFAGRAGREHHDDRLVFHDPTLRRHG